MDPLDLDCIVTPEMTRERLLGIERQLAERFSVDPSVVREHLITRDRANELVEDELVADWHCALASYISDLEYPEGRGPYTRDEVWLLVTIHEEKLFASWSMGRPEGWTTDARTKATVCIAFWLRDELTKIGLSEADRKTQEAYFHRWSRSEGDLFALGAEVMNDARAGNIEQGRVPHHRWG